MFELAHRLVGIYKTSNVSSLTACGKRADVTVHEIHRYRQQGLADTGGRTQKTSDVE